MIAHTAIDANYIGCQVVNEIYSLKSRLTNPHNGLIIAVTRVEGGNENYSAISDKMVIAGSIRSFSVE
jgi:metal-dependent amidase/aminoacylase/carboxypeptidase family protein